MYQSRLHLTNGLVSIALDALNGEILELTLERTWDNVVKNHVRRAYSPFTLTLISPEGKELPAYPARYEQILTDQSLKPEITIEQLAHGGKATLRYPRVMSEAGVHEVAVRVEIELPEGDVRTRWRMAIEKPADDCEVQSALFPCLSGIWLGDDWQSNVLVMPYHAGEKIENPVETIASEPCIVNWKWQEYVYGYAIGGPTGAKDARGAYVRELPYSGAASMLWLDLYDRAQDAGLYMTCRNQGLVMKTLRAESFGGDYPGMGLAIGHYPCLKGGRWAADECIVALHAGDWHWAADEYRAWRESLPKPALKKHRPEWFEKSPGLVAHYDFQYQGGGIVHKYKDIPALLEQARSLGFNHIMLSGWNYDGFDHGFPQYLHNPNLGTEQELIEAVRTVRAMGGHLAFYINARLCNTKYADRAALIQESAVMRRDGELVIEKYGARDLAFAGMCNQSSAWRDEFVGVLHWLTHTVGADSMYLDQLAMASSVLCYHPGHTEHAGNPAGWNQGYEKMLAQMRADYDEAGMAMLYEGASDVYGPGVSGQLISTMFYTHSGAFPELYKYTFPDQVLVDMMNPRRNSGMRAEHVARKSTFLLYRAFVVGSYLWVYDLEWDNTFRRDPEQLARLEKVAALRSAWLAAYGHGRFMDTVGLADTALDPSILLKRYALADGVLLALANEKRLPCEAKVVWQAAGAPRAFARTYEAPGEEREIACQIVKQDGQTIACLKMPDTELAVVVLRA